MRRAARHTLALGSESAAMMASRWITEPTPPSAWTAAVLTRARSCWRNGSCRGGRARRQQPNPFGSDIAGPSPRLTPPVRKDARALLEPHERAHRRASHDPIHRIEQRPSEPGGACQREGEEREGRLDLAGGHDLVEHAMGRGSDAPEQAGKKARRRGEGFDELARVRGDRLHSRSGTHPDGASNARRWRAFAAGLLMSPRCRASSWKPSGLALRGQARTTLGRELRITLGLGLATR
jgi:hypothetical protein